MTPFFLLSRLTKHGQTGNKRSVKNSPEPCTERQHVNRGACGRRQLSSHSRRRPCQSQNGQNGSRSHHWIVVEPRFGPWLSWRSSRICGRNEEARLRGGFWNASSTRDLERAVGALGNSDRRLLELEALGYPDRNCDCNGIQKTHYCCFPHFIICIEILKFETKVLLDFCGSSFLAFSMMQCSLSHIRSRSLLHRSCSTCFRAPADLRVCQARMGIGTKGLLPRP